MIFKSEEEARECLAHWQKILRLQDWDFKLEIKRSRDMRLEGKTATILPDWSTSTAWIELRDATDYPPGCFEEQDQEESLVHELLHVYANAHHRFMNEKQWTDSEQERERLCMRLSEALTQLHRWQPKPLASSKPAKLVTAPTNGKLLHKLPEAKKETV